MHAILVNFHTEVPLPELLAGLREKLAQLEQTPGLICKAFVSTDDHNPGGFYVFESKEAAESYVSGEFFQGFANSPPISNVRVQHYRINDEPSIALGLPSQPLTVEAA